MFNLTAYFTYIKSTFNCGCCSKPSICCSKDTELPAEAPESEHENDMNVTIHYHVHTRHKSSGDGEARRSNLQTQVLTLD